MRAMGCSPFFFEDKDHLYFALQHIPLVYVILMFSPLPIATCLILPGGQCQGRYHVHAMSLYLSNHPVIVNVPGLKKKKEEEEKTQTRGS